MNRLAMCWTATTILALASADTASAGGGTSTGDEAGDSGTTSSASTGDASTSETTGGHCDVCPPNTSAGAIEFSDLDHGRPPAGERVVEVTTGPQCTCSDCMCHDEEATQIRLELDGDSVGEPCANTQCEFVVVFTPGPHELTAIAIYPSGDVSESVLLEVPSPEGGSSETGAPMQDEGDTSGCGCTSSRSAHPLALLVILGALVRRGRSRK